MVMKKAYKGYKAYEYLEKGVDYKEFKMPKAIGRVPEYYVPLTDEQEKRLLEVVDKSIIISLHDHPVFFPEDMSQVFEYNREGRQIAAYEALSKSYLDVVFDNFMDGTCTIGSKAGWKWNDVLHDLGMRLCDLAHQDFVIRAEKVDDIIKAYKEGKIALVPTIEGAAMLENEVERVEILYGFGVRLMGITYSEANSLGSGLKEKNDGGLTALGYKVVERMNKVGMAIDCSHVGDKTTIDIINASTKPVIISHCGSRDLWNSRRLKPDDLLKACADKGGVIGIEAAPHTTLTLKNREHTIDSFMEHFEHLVDVIGIDHLAFGPDTLYGDHVGLHHAFASNLSIKSSHEGTADFEEVEYVKGLENPTEASINIVRWLVKHNYSDEDIAKVLGGNIIRALKDNWY
ncbi:membrane dipeptidase (peptidase family M19) [Oxobacter pfennigii]|uniref:Membrane dipeptidase (Peptidase family M19) n=1 Tax=Oxobacter pfennigii TaxID=36849 RepID=A0A0N8NSL1_9CLOT|nr:membrane dipeptidase [Oxobacter pfennigii]KPU42336.1 membrane dipeptidase (peptidase family M19) [Oxobacter pfennigii]